MVPSRQNISIWNVGAGNYVGDPMHFSTAGEGSTSGARHRAAGIDLDPFDKNLLQGLLASL